MDESVLVVGAGPAGLAVAASLRKRGVEALASVYTNPEPYRGRDVVVVGAGNTGAEIAADLADGGAGSVRMARAAARAIDREPAPELTAA